MSFYYEERHVWMMILPHPAPQLFRRPAQTVGPARPNALRRFVGRGRRAGFGPVPGHGHPVSCQTAPSRPTPSPDRSRKTDPSPSRCCAFEVERCEELKNATCVV